MFILKHRGGQTFRRKIDRDKLLCRDELLYSPSCVHWLQISCNTFSNSHIQGLLFLCKYTCNNGELLIEYIITGTYYLYLLT